MNQKESLKKSIAKNTIWKFFEQFSIIGIQLIGTFILGRYLTSSDFGIVGMLVIFTAIANTIVSSGFGIALIREKNVTNIDYSSVFFFNLAISILLYFILFFSSPLISRFYNQPILNDVSKVTFLVIPVLSLQLVQIAKFEKELKFKELAFISFFSSLLSCIIAVCIAFVYRNVWALVIQNLMFYIIKGILLWIYSDWHPNLSFSYKSISKYFIFSRNILITGLIGNIFNNINALLIGRFYSASELGYYSLAYRINNAASHQLTNIVKNVSFPILSKINNEGGNIKEVYKKVIIITSIFEGLVLVNIMVISEDLLTVLMGKEEWRIAGTFLYILGLGGLLYPLHCINQNILNVKGRGKDILYLEIARRIIMIIIIIIAVNFDIIIFVSSYTFYLFLLSFLNIYVCGRPINYTLKDQISDITPIYFRFGVILIVSFFTNVLLNGINTYGRICLTLFISIVLSCLLFHKHPQINELKKILIGIKSEHVKSR